MQGKRGHLAADHSFRRECVDGFPQRLEHGLYVWGNVAITHRLS